MAKASAADKLRRVLLAGFAAARTPGIFEAPFGTAAFNEAAIVMVTLDDGATRPLASAVRAVMDLWERKLGGVEP